MIRYTVTGVIQSNDLSNPPAEVRWYRGTSLAKAVNALTGAATHDEGTDHGDLPDSMKYRTVSVRLDTEVLPDPDTLTYTVDFNDTDADYALDDCAWYDNQYQPWARVQCYGRMATVTMFKNGHAVMGACLCEGHVNAYNDGELRNDR